MRLKPVNQQQSACFRAFQRVISVRDRGLVASLSRTVRTSAHEVICRAAAGVAEPLQVSSRRFLNATLMLNSLYVAPGLGFSRRVM